MRWIRKGRKTHFSKLIGRVEIYCGMRTSLDIRLGVGMWGFDGWDFWIDLLLLYAGITILNAVQR